MGQNIPMKIVFFTSKNSHAAELLKAIRTAGIQISAIIIEKKHTRSIKKDFIKIRKTGYLELFSILLQKIKRRIIPKKHEEWRRDEYYNHFSDVVITVDNFNSIQCEHIVKEITPDIIVLGGARIIKKNIIKIPRIGILNAHPGLLPKYRGVDVIPWAILNGDDVGVTVHFIDEGVDTGRICIQKRLPIMENDNIQILRKKAEVLAGELIVQVIKTLIKDSTCQTTPNPKEKGRQFYKMDSKTLYIAEQRLKDRLKD